MKLSPMLLLLGLVAPCFGSVPDRRQVSSQADCPGYTASNVRIGGSKIKADLKLSGAACNIYGQDLRDLRLDVEYETGRP